MVNLPVIGRWIKLVIFAEIQCKGRTDRDLGHAHYVMPLLIERLIGDYPVGIWKTKSASSFFFET